jgi:RES domain-containing protein
MPCLAEIDPPVRLYLYRVLYASSRPLGCYLEVLAWYRPDPKVVADMAEIVDNEPELNQTRQAGQLTLEWVEARKIGEIHPTRGQYADVGHSQSLAALNHDLAAEIVRNGLDEIDGAAIRQKAPRTLTRAISRHVYEHTTHDGHLFAGIFYESRHGNELHNYALFENGARWDFEGVSDRALSRDDSDLQQAMTMLRITIV